MTLSVAVVCEDRADRVTITTLAELAILDAARQHDPPWIDPDTLAYHVQWRGFRATDPFLKWTELDPIADELKLVIRFKDERPLHPYSVNALRAIRVLARAPERADAIILVPDSDGDLDRLRGLEQARRFAREALPIVIGLAHTKRECWHIAGFEPEADDERTAIAELRSQLGHDPRVRTEELTAKHDQDKRSAKRVLSELCRNNHDRETRCLTNTPINLLCERGTGNGLAAFIAELRTHIVPLVLGVQPRPATG